MNVAVFGGFGERMLASGWTNESAFCLFGGGDFNLAEVVPGPDARLNATAVFGGIDILVDPDAKVTMSGFSLFGRRQVEVGAGEGPPVHINAVAIFGGIKVMPVDNAS